MRAACILALAGLLGNAQGTTPKPAPRDYAAQAAIPGGVIAADYLVRSFAAGGRTFVIEDYLVVDLAFYPAAGREISLSTGPLSLRINGKRHGIFAQAPSMVAASLKYPDWEQRPELVASAPGVMIGRRPITERFPGDPRPQQRRDPLPLPRVPDQQPVQADEMPAHELVLRSALQEGMVKYPVSGYVYFAYRGKLSALRSLELLISAGNDSQPVVLKLR